jgi:fatty acid desaturase
MRDQLTQYVDLLFAGAEDADDVKQEILQNTLDRYDDLINQGKSPQAAYSLAIAGIGDVSELMMPSAAEAPVATLPQQTHKPQDKKLMRAVAVAFYICCVVPILVLAPLGWETLGVCLMFVLIAAATALLILSASGSKRERKTPEHPENLTPQQAMRKAVKNAVSTVGLVVYFIVSFATGAWHITWLIFPIMGAVQGIVNACMDMKETKEYEN